MRWRGEGGSRAEEADNRSWIARVSGRQGKGQEEKQGEEEKLWLFCQ